jgi:hypothetical protein
VISWLIQTSQVNQLITISLPEEKGRKYYTLHLACLLKLA